MTSPAVHDNAQLICGVNPEGMGAGAAGAAVIDAWGTANAPAKRAKMTVVYFIVMDGIVDASRNGAFRSD
jgi:hypothetical protein